MLPRPFWYGEVQALTTEKSFGFPSATPKRGAALDFSGAAKLESRLWVPLALLLAVAIAFSRLVLGVHYPAMFWAAPSLVSCCWGLWQWRCESERRVARFETATRTHRDCGVWGSLFYACFRIRSRRSAGAPSALARTSQAAKVRASFRVWARCLACSSGCHLRRNSSVRHHFAQNRPILIGFAGLAIFYLGLKAILPDELPFASRATPYDILDHLRRALDYSQS
jgi:membrane-associated phospholipid phosphatase